MSLSSTSFLWREPKAPHPFSTGVSLHSHTNQSRETLDFLAELSTDWPFLQPVMRLFERRCVRFSGIHPDYARGYWTPPLNPAAAFTLEATQITNLNLAALVSLSDHDDIRAPDLLRSVSFAPEIPISTEWTVPFGHTTLPQTSVLPTEVEDPPSPLVRCHSDPERAKVKKATTTLSSCPSERSEDPLYFAFSHRAKRRTQTPPPPSTATCFHLGIHNLPPADATTWTSRFAALTATPAHDLPSSLHRDAVLTDLLAALHDLPGVLIVFNHPLWDLYRIGEARHNILVHDFLARFGQFLHALELNGLRNWKENRDVAALAGRWNMLSISGGDRHGIEPNANINLSRASTFTGFVHEVRRERSSHVLFMPQYVQPWKHRILQSTLDAVRNHPHLPQGSQRWDERVFHPDSTGDIKPLSTLWISGAPTPFISTVLAAVRLLGARPVAAPLRFAWSQNRTEATAKRLALTAEA